jgi:sterol desaturase/sphingolipid hydroxylase (fatty acid hydroxylase superfamily)
LFASDEATYQLARAFAAALALGAALVLERLRPHQRLHPAWSANLGLWAVDAAVMAVACGACGWTVAAWAAAHGVGLFPVLGVGGGLAVAVGVVGLDAVSYAWHRANHRIALLWRFHRVHHADAAFHVTTGLRFHPGELLLALPVRLAAVVALGVPAEGVLVFELVFGAANLLEHGNFDLPRRLEHGLQRALVTPALHRAHHVADWRDLDTNFGTIFSVWDRLARTLQPSEPDRAVVTGLPGRAERDAPAFAESLRLPFARSRRA